MLSFAWRPWYASQALVGRAVLLHNACFRILFSFMLKKTSFGIPSRTSRFVKWVRRDQASQAG